jgi:peptidoglycan/xylan/chitin deacetylase (PgdA/CDA1 family)
MRSPFIAALGAAGLWSVPALAPLVPSLCRALRVARRLDPADGAVAITFDDGPHPEGTPAVLQELDRRGARATFFLVGEQVERRPALAAEIAAAGHGIALHGHLHRNLLRVPPRALASDLDRASAVIAEATGAVPDLYRPPYGIFSPAGLVLARRRGVRPLLWSRWGRDWRARATPASIAAEVTRGLEAGDVLLLHDADFYSAEGSWRSTVAALPSVLDEIARLGLRPVTA